MRTYEVARSSRNLLLQFAIDYRHLTIFKVLTKRDIFLGKNKMNPKTQILHLAFDAEMFYFYFYFIPSSVAQYLPRSSGQITSVLVGYHGVDI